ncbi:MAG: c-type cytochrome [Syntrophothermus sp.]
MKLTTRKIFFILFILPLWVQAQKWTAPAEAREIVAPFLFNDESIKAGEAIYTKNCKSCHGPVGMNTPAPISPQPVDPASASFQSQTDGEIFWKVTNGKSPMPQFGSILSEEERWQVISYIRNFNPKYIQPAPAAQGIFKGVRLQLAITWDSILKKIKITALQIGENNKLTPFKGANIQLSVQRMFGRMNFGEIHKTNAEGIALVDFPPDIPGDKNGTVEIHAQVSQEGVIARAAVTKLTIAKPANATGLYTKNMMWSKKGEGPVWLSLFYGSVISVIWLFIIYVIFQTIKMGKLGGKK